MALAISAANCLASLVELVVLPDKEIGSPTSTSITFSSLTRVTIACTDSEDDSLLESAAIGLDKIPSGSQVARPIRTDPTSIARRLPFLI
jgi:hypothetical protein